MASYETITLEEALVDLNQENGLSDADHDRLQREVSRLRNIAAKANLFLSEWRGGNGQDPDTCDAADDLQAALVAGMCE